MASYPSGPATFPARSDGQTIFAQHVQILQDEIAALEAGLLSTGLQHALWGAQALTMSGVLTPPQITATQNNYAPAGLSSAFLLRLTSDATRGITGLLAQPAGRVICLVNANTIAASFVLGHQDPASSATNRFECPGAVALTLDKGASAWLYYDTASSFWRIITTSTPAAVAPSAIAGKVVATAAQSLGTAATYTTLTFSNYDFQVGGVAWVSGANTRITIPAGTGANGFYLFGANVQSPTAAQLRVRFMKGGAVCSTEMRMGAATSIAMGINVQTLINMQPGDYMEVQAWLSTIGTVGGSVRDDMVEFFYAKQNP